MKTPEKIAHRWFNEVWNNREVSLVHELMSPEAIGHIEGPVPTIVGAQKFIEFQNDLLSALPDIHVEILNSLSDDTTACVLWKASARGGSITFKGTTWFRIADGKIIEGWDCWDHGAVTAALSTM